MPITEKLTQVRNKSILDLLRSENGFLLSDPAKKETLERDAIIRSCWRKMNNTEKWDASTGLNTLTKLKEISPISLIELGNFTTYLQAAMKLFHVNQSKFLV